MNDYRIEKDSMGEVKVSAEKLWGAQTQRSLENFAIGGKVMRMPEEIIRAFAMLKKAAANVNADLGVLQHEKAKSIGLVCDEIIAGKHKGEFPLKIFQTGSGTHTNMNMNEVIANRGHVLMGGSIDEPVKKLHPNDDVNKSQSSNDTFPTAMNLAAYTKVVESLLPALEELRQAIEKKVLAFKDVVKLGRTHCMDATPLTLANEFSAYQWQLKFAEKALRNSLPHLSQLALGGTAVGTGLNAPKQYAEKVAGRLAEYTGHPFITAENKFEALSASDAIVETSGAVKQLAVVLMKLGNDIRLLSSGPRCGIAEIKIPAHEPGSSIMPGKVNPTQAEALTMAASHALGCDATIAIGAMTGHFQLNVFRPVIIYNFLMACSVLADACVSFTRNCMVDIEPDFENIEKNLKNSLMLVTALNTHIGYDKAAEIAKKAYTDGSTLKEAALALGYVTAEDFDAWVVPEKMITNL